MNFERTKEFEELLALKMIRGLPVLCPKCGFFAQEEGNGTFKITTLVVKTTSGTSKQLLNGFQCEACGYKLKQTDF